MRILFLTSVTFVCIVGYATARKGYLHILQLSSEHPPESLKSKLETSNAFTLAIDDPSSTNPEVKCTDFHKYFVTDVHQAFFEAMNKLLFKFPNDFWPKSNGFGGGDICFFVEFGDDHEQKLKSVVKEAIDQFLIDTTEH